MTTLPRAAAFSLADAASLLFLAAIWGGSFLFMRVAAPQFGPLALIEVRVAIAALFLLSVSLWRGEARALLRDTGPLVLLGAFNSALPFVLFAYATLSLPAGFASVLNATVPLFVALIGAVWLGERFGPRRVVGLALGFAGVVALVWPKLGATDERLAVAAGLAASVSYAVCGHYTKRRFARVSPLAIATGSQIAAALLLAPLAAWHLPATLPDARAWFAVVALGVLCTAVAYLVYFRLVARVDATHASVVTYLVPVFGIAWGALFLGEVVTLAMLVGAAVVLAGVVLVTRRARA